MTTKLQIQQAAARVQQCLEDPPHLCSISWGNNHNVQRRIYRRASLASVKCEQELVRLDEGRLDEARLDPVDIDLKSFDEILAPLRFLHEKRLMNIC